MLKGEVHLHKFIEDESGNTLIELIMVMVLMVFFGFTIFTLIQTGSHTEQRIIANKNAQVDARIALSYITVRVRKNDTVGRVEVATVEHTGQDAILIKTRTFEDEYDRWIYFSGGKLLECLTNPDEQPEDDLSTVIVEIDGFTISYDSEKNALVASVEYEYGEKQEKMDTFINLRNTKTEGIIIL